MMSGYSRAQESEPSSEPGAKRKSTTDSGIHRTKRNRYTSVAWYPQHSLFLIPSEIPLSDKAVATNVREGRSNAMEERNANDAPSWAWNVSILPTRASATQSELALKDYMHWLGTDAT